MNLSVFISGRGSHLRNFIEKIWEGYLKWTQLKLVIANKEAPGLRFAKEWNIPFLITSDEEIILDTIRYYDINLIALAGFDQILTSWFLERFNADEWRIMNIHPALLPAFKGNMHAQKDALEYGVKVSGCTVHFIDEGVDTGPIILQRAVPILDDDTEDSLSERILKIEHVIYPKAVKLFAEGRLHVEGRKVRIR